MTVLSVLDAAASLAGDPARLPRRPPTAQQGNALPGRPADVEEIVAVMRHAADDRHGWRVRAMIAVSWRAGLRIQEALALAEHDLDARLAAGPQRQGRTATRGRHGRVGLGAATAVGERTARSGA